MKRAAAAVLLKEFPTKIIPQIFIYYGSSHIVQRKTTKPTPNLCAQKIH